MQVMVIVACLLISRIIRLSPWLGRWLFGNVL